LGEAGLRVLRLLVEDAAVFAEEILDVKLYPYQAEILRDRSRRIVVCGGRQVGKTFMAAVKALHFASTNPRTTTLIISATHRQSRHVLSKIINLIQDSILSKSVRRLGRDRVYLSNGSMILALPSGRFGHGIRGYTAHLVILDEAAFIHEEVITRAVLPMLSATGGTCWMLSTPWDRRHIFYRVYQSRHWSSYHLPSTLNPLISREFLEEQRNLIGEERFRAEYLAEFIDEEGSYFPMSLLRRRVEDYTPKPVEGMIVGYDPGGRESYAAAVGLSRRADGRLQVSWWIAEKTSSYTYFNLKLREMHEKTRFTSLLVDETGIGAPILEYLRKLGLPAHGVVLTERSRCEIMIRLKLALERGILVLPNSPELLASLNCVTYEATWRGTYRFSHRHGTHDDLAYALALAVWAARGAGKVLVAPLNL